MRGMRTTGMDFSTDFGDVKAAKTELPLARLQKTSVEKCATYFDIYDMRATCQARAGVSDVNYSALINILNDAGIRYREERRYNVQPDRVVLEILIQKDDIEAFNALNKEYEDRGYTFTFNDNLPEDIQDRVITTPEKELDEKVTEKSAGKKTSAYSDNTELDDFLEHIRYHWDGDKYYDSKQDADIIEMLESGRSYLDTYQEAVLNNPKTAGKKTAGELSEDDFVEYLNDIGVPDHDDEENGGRVPAGSRYGEWLRDNDPIAFNVGYNEYVQEMGLNASKKTAGTELYKTPDDQYWLLSTVTMTPVSDMFSSKEEAVNYGIESGRWSDAIRERLLSEDVDGVALPEDFKVASKKQADLSEKVSNEFLDYVMAFYGPTSRLYPMAGLTREDVAKATEVVRNNSDFEWGGGDSLDRERVRDILIDDMGYEQFVRSPKNWDKKTADLSEKGWFTFSEGTPGYLYVVVDNILYSAKETDIGNPGDAFAVTKDSFMSEEEFNSFADALQSETGYDLRQSPAITIDASKKTADASVPDKYNGPDNWDFYSTLFDSENAFYSGPLLIGQSEENYSSTIIPSGEMFVFVYGVEDTSKNPYLKKVGNDLDYTPGDVQQAIKISQEEDCLVDLGGQKWMAVNAAIYAPVEDVNIYLWEF